MFVHVNYATPDPSFTREELMERLDGVLAEFGIEAKAE